MSATIAATSRTEPWSAVTRFSENIPMNGSTNGWVMLKTNCTTSLPRLATSSSRMMRRISATCRIPNSERHDAGGVVVAPPGPDAT